MILNFDHDGVIVLPFAIHVDFFFGHSLVCVTCRTTKSVEETNVYLPCLIKLSGLVIKMVLDYYSALDYL